MYFTEFLNKLKGDVALENIIILDAIPFLDMMGSNLRYLKDAFCLIYEKVQQSEIFVGAARAAELQDLGKTIEGITNQLMWQALSEHLRERGISDDIINELSKSFNPDSPTMISNPTFIPNYLKVKKDGSYEVKRPIFIDFLIRRINLCKVMGQLSYYSGTGYIFDNKKLKEVCASLTETLFTASIDFQDLVDKKLQFRRLLKRPLTDPTFVAFENGVLEIDYRKPNPQSLTLHHHDPHFVLLNPMPIKWNAYATSEKVEKFRDDLSDGDESLKNVQTEIAAAGLLNDCRLKKGFMCVGQKSCGKSTFFKFLRKIFGEENCSDIMITDFTKNFYLDGMKGKRANFSDDTSSSTITARDSAQGKKVVSGEMVTTDAKFKDKEQWQNYSTQYVSENEPSVITDVAYFERWLIVKFPHVFDEGEIPDILTDEEAQQAYVVHMVAALMRILKNIAEHVKDEDGHQVIFTRCQMNEELTDRLRQTNDPVRVWADEALQGDDRLVRARQIVWPDDISTKGPAERAAFTLRGIFAKFRQWLTSSNDFTEDVIKYWNVQGNFSRRLCQLLPIRVTNSPKEEVCIDGKPILRRWQVFKLR